MKNPLIHIVIVSYNGKENLKFSLPTLINQKYYNFKIFIADNNSTDGTKEWIKENYPSVFYMNQTMNIGMAAMNEVLTWPKQNGINEDPDYIFVAGWDLKFEPRTLQHSVDVMEKNLDVGVLGYEVIGLFEWVDSTELEKKANEWEKSEFKDVTWVPGACSFFRKGLLDNIGFIDPVYFAYAEEDDLQFRIRKTRFRMVIINTFCWQDAKVGVIPKKKASYLYFRNIIRFHTKSRGIIFGLKVALSILNTACNPYIKLNLNIRVNQRKRPFKIYSNFKIWIMALFWNIKNILNTIESGKNDKIKVELGKKYFSQLNNR